MIAARLLAVAGLVGAAPTSAQMPVAAPADIVAVTQACRAVTGPTGVDEAKLAAAGWSAATISDHGKPVSTPLRFFSKTDVKGVMLMTSRSKLCLATARIADAAAFGTIAHALDLALSVPRKAEPDEPNAGLWFPAGHLVQLQLTGKAAAPGVRVSVMSMPQEKQ